MNQNDDTATNRRGSSPAPEAEQIYHEWLKRPRSGGTTLEEKTPGEVAKKDPDENLSDTPLATTNIQR